MNVKGLTELFFSASSVITNLNTKDAKGRTLLHRAAIRGDADLVNSLIMLGADTMARDIDGSTPLHYSALYGHKKSSIILIEQGRADVQAEDNGGFLPLHYAAWKGQTEIVKDLLERGSDVNAKGQNNLMPLHFAVDGSHVDTATYLIENGAHIYAKNDRGQTAPQFAEEQGNTLIAHKLREISSLQQAQRIKSIRSLRDKPAR